MHEQDTVDEQFENTTLKGRGRHDPCVLPRAVPMVEAMTALVLWITRCGSGRNAVDILNRNANYFNQHNILWPKKLSTKSRPICGGFTPRPVRPRSGKTPITPSTLFCQMLEKEPGFFDCRKALRAAQFKKAGGGSTRIFQKNDERRGFIAADRQGQNGVGQKSRRGHGHRRAGFERRPEQFLRAPHHRGRGARRWSCRRRRCCPRKRWRKIRPRTRTLAIEFADALAAAGDVSERRKQSRRKNPAWI